jgi:hypothetical protein
MQRVWRWRLESLDPDSPTIYLLNQALYLRTEMPVRTVNDHEWLVGADDAQRMDVHEVGFSQSIEDDLLIDVGAHAKYEQSPRGAASTAERLDSHRALARPSAGRNPTA